MRRALLATLGVVLMASACGRVPSGPLTAGDYKLYVAASTQSSQQVSIIDSRSHSTERSLPLGTPSPGWTHLYALKSPTTNTFSSNVLLDIDPQTGATLRTVQLPGSFQLPRNNSAGVPEGLSQDGHWLVLEAADFTSESVPKATHFALVDTTYKTPVRKIDLSGYFWFDAVSNDGQRIYIIQYVSNTEYYVRFYDVTRGVLDPNVIFDKADGSAAMAGTRLSGMASPDGHWLYSIYVRQDKSAFIHMLSLDNAIAFCLDLPGSGYNSNPDEYHWSLALSGDGSHLYAANGQMGIVAVADVAGNGLPVVTRTAHVDSNGTTAGPVVQNVQAKEFGANSAVISPDGRTLVIASRDGVAWVDAATLKVLGRRLSGWTVWTLGASTDGKMVYAIKDSGDIAELSFTPGHVGASFAGASGQPMALVRVEAAGA